MCTFEQNKNRRRQLRQTQYKQVANVAVSTKVACPWAVLGAQGWDSGTLTVKARHGASAQEDFKQITTPSGPQFHVNMKEQS